MLVTVSGPPGSGKSTTARALADRFGLAHVSGGDIFRGLAADRGLTPLELNRQAEEDPSIDRELDQRLQQTAIDRDELLLESRLSGWLAGSHATLRIWLDAPLSVRAKRIADREDKSIDAAETDMRHREESERKRYQDYYGIDIQDLSIYDLSINTARWDESAVPELIAQAIEHYDPAVDEGQTPTAIEL